MERFSLSMEKAYNTFLDIGVRFTVTGSYTFTIVSPENTLNTLERPMPSPKWQN